MSSLKIEECFTILSWFFNFFQVSINLLFSFFFTEYVLYDDGDISFSPVLRGRFAVTCPQQRKFQKLQERRYAAATLRRRIHLIALRPRHPAACIQSTVVCQAYFGDSSQIIHANPTTDAAAYGARATTAEICDA